MPIPKSRIELTESLTSSFEKLRQEFDGAGPGVAKLTCVDDWTVRDLLAVRAWWTENVHAWIEAGRRGERPTTPAPGYAWNETPRLNADLVEAARAESFKQVLKRLEQGFARILVTIEELDDDELLKVGAFEWAGKWPIARWISLNTTRQYMTARTHIRRALRKKRD